MRGLIFFSILFSCSAQANFAAQTIKQVPIQTLITNLSAQISKAKAGWPRNRLKLNLARLYAMAYALPDENAPAVQERSGELRPDFESWLKEEKYTLRNQRSFPAAFAPAASPQKLELLAKSTEAYRDLLKDDAKDFFGRMGLAWVLIQAGKKDEAKSLLAGLLTEQKRETGKSEDPFAPVAFVSLALGRDVGNLNIAANGKKVFSQPLYPYLIWEQVKGAHFKQHGKETPVAWRELSKKFLANPVKENFEALLNRIQADTKSESKIYDSEGPLVREVSPNDFINSLRSIYALGNGGAPNSSIDATSATTVEQCLKLPGNLEFREGSFSAKLLCVTGLAWKKKNWGLCRDNLQDEVSPSQLAGICYNYLAFRSQKKELCDEIDAFYKRYGMGFERYGYECREYASRSIKKLETNPSKTPFFAEGDWDLAKTTVSSGLLILEIKSSGDSSVSLEFAGVNFSNGPRDETGRSENVEVRDYRRNPGKPRSTDVKVSLVSRDGKESGSESFKLPLPPTKESYGPVTPDFKLEEAIGAIHSAEAAIYYISLLDPVKEKAEIDRVREQIWYAYKEAESMPQAITPLAVSLSGEQDPANLINRNASVTFDLYGNGIPQRWNWLNPSAGWLMYRADGDERPASGMHLFGMTTFWLFWQNGFEPLAALDSNQDGKLAGRELDHIFLWIDKNGNGLQDKGETRSMIDLNTDWIDVNYAAHPTGLLWAPKGIHIKSGSSMPIFDLMLDKAVTK